MKNTILTITTEGKTENGVISLTGNVVIHTNNKELQLFSKALEQELTKKFWLIVIGNPNFVEKLSFVISINFNAEDVESITLLNGDVIDFISIKILIEDFLRSFKF